jgi:hypothetical protein
MLLPAHLLDAAQLKHLIQRKLLYPVRKNTFKTRNNFPPISLHIPDSVKKKAGINDIALDMTSIQQTPSSL